MSTKAVISIALLLLLASSQAYASEEAASLSREGAVSTYFEKIRDNPEELRAFFLAMPKGGDIHNHLTGAVYAEGLIDRASSEKECICLSNYSILANCSTNNETIPVGQAYRDQGLYDSIVDRWSMRDSELLNISGHDQFFSTFSKFDGATEDMGSLVAELRHRAALENVSYLEIMMMTRDCSGADILGTGLGWDDNLTSLYDDLISHGLKDMARNASLYISKGDARSIELMEAARDPGRNVTVRYQYHALRYNTPQVVFAELALAFELAKISPLVVGINLVAAEDGRTSREDYSLHMKMIDFLHGIYPDVKIALHAGELDLGLVPPEDLRFHVREAVEVGHASRIGHGVDIMSETGSRGTLAEMARDKVAVEIMPVSNREILGVQGEDHPFPVYLRYGVPIVLASDDPGVLRTDLTEQFVIIAHTYPQVNYSDFKKFVRNSLEYSFLEGDGIWESPGNYSKLRNECDGCRPGQERDPCRKFLEGNEKGGVEWRLEEDLAAFEKNMVSEP